MPAIFLSYRRSDTSGHAGRLAAELRGHFGHDEVFQDVETITPGSDFARTIEAAVLDCRVVLVLIGDTWLTERDAAGRSRLEDPHDFVRIEVCAALAHDCAVLPVLLEGADMPAASQLPEPLRPLARLQAIELSDTRWDYDVGRILAAVETLAGESPGRTRRRVLVALGGAVVAGLGGGAWWWWRRPPQLGGRWDLPDGGWWVITQEGRRLTIDEVHHQSKEVWLRGKGRIEGRSVQVRLEFVHSEGDARGQLELDSGNDVLRGNLRTRPRGSRLERLLTRRR